MRVYADNAATTKVSPKVVEAMIPYMTEGYGNPSSLHSVGQEAAEHLLEAREIMAKALGCQAREIYFTSGGSEADNQAIRSAAMFGARKGKKHIISTAFEHHAVLHTLQKLEKEGFEVTYLDVKTNHNITAHQVKDAIRPDTCLVTVMYANNEIGTIEPLKEIGAIAKEHQILFHTDAVQAYGQVPINVDELNIDMLSSSGHKINGPKGIGFLYIRKGVKIRSFVHGGAQERKRRAGTENIPAIVGYGAAVERAICTMKERTEKEMELRDYMINRVLEEIPYTKLNTLSIEDLMLETTKFRVI